MWPLEFDRVAPSRTLLTRAKRESKTGEARHALSAHRASSCPSWDRTRTLLIQSQACCQLHQGAAVHGAEGARTPDLLGAIQALSQLSYSPARGLKLTTQTYKKKASHTLT